MLQYVCTLMYTIRIQKKSHCLLIPICEFWNLSSKICVIQKRNKQILHVVSMSKPPPKIMSWKINGIIKIKACEQDPKLMILNNAETDPCTIQYPRLKLLFKPIRKSKVQCSHTHKKKLFSLQRKCMSLHIIIRSHQNQRD